MPPPETPLERCQREQREFAALIAAGHPEQRGLHQALYYWQTEAILLGDGVEVE